MPRVRPSHRPLPPPDVGPAGLRTFFHIMEVWGLDSRASRRLLAVPKTTFYRWREAPSKARVSRDTLERLSYILGIYGALHRIYPVDAIADGWLFRPNDNPLFSGRRPIERLLAGNVADLYLVKQHLIARGSLWE